MKKIKHLTLSLVAASLLLTGCGPVPTSTNTSSNGTNTSTNSNQTNNQYVLSAEAKAAFASMYENEGLFQDSEVIASNQTGFNTKGLLGSVLSGVGSIVKETLNGVANIVGTTLDVSSDLISSLGRTNFSVKVSAVVNTTNNDGSNTKTVSVDFTSKTGGTTKNDKVAKTFQANGNVKLDHYLTVDFDNFGKVATRTETMSGSQKSYTTNSSAKLASGATIVINENRDNTNGSGTVVITSATGAKTNYTFNSVIDASGKLMIKARDTAQNADITIVEKSDTTATATFGANQTVDLNTQLASETYASVN